MDPINRSLSPNHDRQHIYDRRHITLGSYWIMMAVSIQDKSHQPIIIPNRLLEIISMLTNTTYRKLELYSLVLSFLAITTDGFVL